MIKTKQTGQYLDMEIWRGGRYRVNWTFGSCCLSSFFLIGYRSGINGVGTEFTTTPGDESIGGVSHAPKDYRSVVKLTCSYE